MFVNCAGLFWLAAKAENTAAEGDEVSSSALLPEHSLLSTNLASHGVIGCRVYPVWFGNYPCPSTFHYHSAVTTYHWFRFNRHHFQELCLMYQQSDGKINMTRTNKAVSSCHPLFCQQQYKNRAKACVHKFEPLFQQTSTDCPYRTHTSGI